MNTILPHEPSTGVTGYRKLVDSVAVAEAVDRLLEQIHGMLASAGEFPEGSEAAPKTF